MAANEENTETLKIDPALVAARTTPEPFDVDIRATFALVTSKRDPREDVEVMVLVPAMVVDVVIDDSSVMPDSVLSEPLCRKIQSAAVDAARLSPPSHLTIGCPPTIDVLKVGCADPVACVMSSADEPRFSHVATGSRFTRVLL
jgi:hypothetical protein